MIKDEEITQLKETIAADREKPEQTQPDSNIPDEITQLRQQLLELQKKYDELNNKKSA